MVCDVGPEHCEPPHAALHVRVRVVVPVCVTHEALQGYHVLQTPLTALMQQFWSTDVAGVPQSDEHAYWGTLHVRLLVRVA